MQGQDTQKPSNVVSLFNAREKAPEGTEAAPATPALATPELDDLMVKNARNQERMAKERANANKSVLRSYRIKH